MMSGASSSHVPTSDDPSNAFAPDDGRDSEGTDTVSTVLELGQLIFAEDWTAVQDAVLRDPGLASLWNWAFKTPLHMCCEQGAPPDVVRVVIRAHPTAASARDIFGYTPLHVTFASEDCREVARELIRADPAALLAKDKQGYVPLHRAVSSGAPLPVIMDLIEACPESVFIASHGRSLPLDRADVPTVEAILSSGPEAVRRDVGSVLHWAFRPRPSVTVDLRSLVSDRPGDLRQADGRGMLPLHVACGLRADFPYEHLAEILRAHPAAATVADGEGCLPIHHACQSDHAHRDAADSAREVGMFRELIKATGNEALARVDAGGKTPLHLACRNRCLRPEEFLLLLEACPEAIRMEDDSGSTPVASFMDGCCCHDSDYFVAHALLGDEKVWMMLNMLLRRFFDDESEKPLEDGSFTLHSCLRVECCPWDFLWIVALRYPDQIAARDARGRLPLHAAATHLDDSNDATSLLLDLICHHPDALSKCDNEGNYPLSLMIKGGRKWGRGVREAVISFPQALHNCNIHDALLPRIVSRIGTTNNLEAMFQLIRGKPHKFFGGGTRIL